ncbi:hypothetical protein AAFF_G00180900 [Aldrovandia affinis]|uniref:Secreted protein n=1 Tax=Aldrovandia affinis TaxID=143900 RepID=A0AAD7SYK1_9TELE|nr:hypothetical protein AAFF_G00180900 [Aldrovandia affinis]
MRRAETARSALFAICKLSALVVTEVPASHSRSRVRRPLGGGCLQLGPPHGSRDRAPVRTRWTDRDEGASRVSSRRGKQLLNV